MFCIAAGMGMTELQKVLELFRDIDESNTGYLSMEDIRCCLRSFDVARDPKKLMVTLDLDQESCDSNRHGEADSAREHPSDARLVDHRSGTGPFLGHSARGSRLDGDAGVSRRISASQATLGRATGAWSLLAACQARYRARCSRQSVSGVRSEGFACLCQPWQHVTRRRAQAPTGVDTATGEGRVLLFRRRELVAVAGQCARHLTPFDGPCAEA